MPSARENRGKSRSGPAPVAHLQARDLGAPSRVCNTSAALANAARSRFEKTRDVIPLIGTLDQRTKEIGRKVARGRHPFVAVDTSYIEVLRDLLEPSNSDSLTKPRFEHPDVAARPDSQSVREILLRESAVHPRMPNEAPYLLRRTLRRHRHRQPFPAQRRAIGVSSQIWLVQAVPNSRMETEDPPPFRKSEQPRQPCEPSTNGD
jgi:hypothetical protein